MHRVSETFRALNKKGTSTGCGVWEFADSLREMIDFFHFETNGSYGYYNNMG